MTRYTVKECRGLWLVLNDYGTVVYCGTKSEVEDYLDQKENALCVGSQPAE